MSSKKEFLTELVKDNDLNLEEDIFRMPLGGKQVAIITRTGIEKIQYNNNIQVFFDTEVVERVIEFGDDFGFGETVTDFNSDGTVFSESQQRDVEP